MGGPWPHERRTLLSVELSPCSAIVRLDADGVSLNEFIEDFRIERAAAEVVLRAAGIELHSRE